MASRAAAGATQAPQGPISAGAASSVREWGYGLRALPHAGLKPGFINVRIYQGHLLDALLNARRSGAVLDVEGMFDWFVTEVRCASRGRCRSRSRRPMGERTEIVLARRARGWRDRLACRVGDDRGQEEVRWDSRANRPG